MIKKFQLKNGLKVILVPGHKSPVVSVQMWVRTGSADEKKGEEGLCHFLEHLVFKGTAKYGVGEIAARVEGDGGELNAYTSFDQTVFYVTISKEFQGTALDVIAEMMGRPKFDPEEINREREVVLEEIKRTHDSPQRQASRLLFSTAYLRHPYRNPVIGYAENIRKVSARKLEKFYYERYLPKNMTLVVSGDFDQGAMASRIRESFSFMKSKAPIKIRRPREPIKKKPALVAEEGPFLESTLTLAWPVPEVKHPDTPALDMLALLLGQGDSSRLVKKLRLETPLTQWIYSSAFSSVDPGLFSISASIQLENLVAVLESLDREISGLFQRPPGQEELNRAKVNILSDEYYTLETADGLARKFGTYDRLFGRPDHATKFLRQCMAVQAKDILRVAKKYLKSEKMVLTLMGPKGTAKHQKSLRAWHSKLRPQREVLKAKNFKAPRFSWRSSSAAKIGVQSFAQKGMAAALWRSSDTPVLSLRLGWRGGAREEGPGEHGAFELLSRVWISATQLRTESEFLHELESCAASLSAFGGRNSFGLSLTCLSPMFSRVRDLAVEALHQPLLLDAVVERERAVLEEERRKREDNPAQTCLRALHEGLFSGHPYSRDPLGDPRDLARMNSNSLLDFLRRHAVNEGIFISAAGDVDIPEIKSFAESCRAGLSQNAPREMDPSLSPLIEEKIFKTQSKKNQTHISLGFRGLTVLDEDRFALSVIQALLSGQGGRLFIELRDKKSLAYSVSPIRMDGIDTGYFGAYIACSPEKTDLAVTMIREQLNRLTEDPVHFKELDRAQRYLIGRHDIELQKNSSLASTLFFDSLYGLAPDAFTVYSEKIRSVQPQDLMRVARKVFSQKSVLSIVGP